MSFHIIFCIFDLFQLQPNSASGSGALEHDAQFLYVQCPKVVFIFSLLYSCCFLKIDSFILSQCLTIVLDGSSMRCLCMILGSNSDRETEPNV